MGKVEKVIVLSVLFLIALILVVSLTVDDPLNKARVVEAGAPAGKGPAAERVQPPAAPGAGTPVAAAPAAPAAATGLLSTNVAPVAANSAGGTPTLTPAPTPAQPTAATAVATPAADPAAALAAPSLPTGALLRSLDGLEDSILPDMKLYTWKEGDTYRGIAQKYYGAWEKFTVLRRSNEGRNEVKPGQKIFVPVFDSDASAVALAERANEPKGAKKAASAAKVAGEAVAVKDAPAAGAATGKKVHLVKDGESLWKIAKQELGDGSRWKEIFELNKDVLAKPESVHKGQRLRIP